MIEIKVPVRLISEANNTVHWRVKHKRKKAIKAMLEQYWTKEKVKLPCEIELVRVAPRRCDGDNNIFSMKFCRDFVADKIIPGLQPGRADDDDRIKWEYSQEKGAPREYGLIIRLTF